MEKTGIIWTEKTWNPVTGCQQITEGCRYCYAKTIAEKFTIGFPKGFEMMERPHKLNDPLRWKEPSLIFVNSMSDLFWEEISEDYRHKIIDIIEQTPHHEYQILTKRTEKMLEFSKKRPLPGNFWAGTTIENKRNLYRLEILKQINAKIRFISMEPILEDIATNYDLNDIHWVITGGESGTHLWNESICKKRGLVVYDKEIRKFIPTEKGKEIINNIFLKCRAANTAFFHKQWGGNYPEAAGRILNGKTYNEMPLLFGGKRLIKNEYLEKIESMIGKG